MSSARQWITWIAGSSAKQMEVIVAFMVVVVIFMLILPFPPAVVDALIGINICISCLLVVLVSYMPGPQAFSTFPTVLLLTTLFRLALSISTTRLILLEADAGDIVEGFGNFVVGGNLAVGMVVFLIITVAQFMVIAKGSERVAEVAARFTLDAMPGKQMSIDADMRAGIIDPLEAMDKREQLSKESQLFGAMDGAMKFVKGDNIAGLIIVMVNLIGGFSVGVLQHGMSAPESMHLYSVLTIGDGLVAQIPALMISITAGLMITRVAPDASEDGNVGLEMTKQLLSEPKAWLVSSGAMFIFGFVPGMPTPVFVSLALVTGFIGGYGRWRRKEEYEARLAEAMAEPMNPAEVDGEDLVAFKPFRPFLLQFHPSMESEPEAMTLFRAIRRVRNRLVSEYGLTLPSLHSEVNESLSQGEFRFCVYEVPMLRASYHPRHWVIETDIKQDLSSLDERIFKGKDAWQESRYWFAPQGVVDPNTLQLPIKSSVDYIAERVEQQLFIAAPKFIGIHETKMLVGAIGEDYPSLIEEMERVMPLAGMAKILKRLVAERVSIRAFRTIVEAIVEHGQHEREPALLTEIVRHSLRDQIVHHCADEEGLKVWLITPETEEMLRSAARETQSGAFLALTPDARNNLLGQMAQAFDPFVHPSPILVVSQDLRRVMRSLLEEQFNHVHVFAYTELPGTIEIQVLGRFTLPVELLEEKNHS